MKRTLIALALCAAFAAQAQDSSSTSQSGSNSGSQSTAGAVAVGNSNASESNSASLSGAVSGSTSGAAGNVTVLNQNVPDVQTVNTTVNGSTTANATVNNTNNNSSTSNEKYDGTQRVITSGGVNDTLTTHTRISGNQTIKNVPSIAMSGPASGPCTGVSGGLGLAGPGWGIGLNGAAVQADCVVRENVRVIGMAMQSLDGGAYPQEKGEATVLFMEALRGLADMNRRFTDGQAK
jgi:hypothetical protein